VIRLTLSSRLVVVYSAIFFASTGAFAWLQVRSSALEEQKLVQLLSVDVAEHIAARVELSEGDGLTTNATTQLFDQLMSINPSVEVYVLDPSGGIVGHAAPPGHVMREAVDLSPIQNWLAGQPAPIFGDDPRSVTEKKVFSAARLTQGGQTLGYIYVILLSEARDLLARDAASDRALQKSLTWMAIVAVLGILVGAIALHRLTLPLRALAKSLHELDVDQLASDSAPPPTKESLQDKSDEIAILRDAFNRMASRIGDQWRALRRQDEQRRELVANVSHDLRTPLTSLQGYLEALESKADSLSDAERNRYLSTARSLSEKLSSLARELLDLARLEHETVAVETEPFSIVDLIQDVFEKLFVLAEGKGQNLVAELPEGIPNVVASLSLIERVLTNLLSNAIRHTPDGTTIL
jgi:signal transduction histidine kinase